MRGVILGRDQQAKGLDVRDIRWSVRPPSPGQPGTRVGLDVRLARGWTELGVFDAAVVNQALRYAADGRVIATTITPGDGQAIRRLTYLHPMLVDTPLGCRVIEADRFVDTFSVRFAGSPTAAQLAELSGDREHMGRWMFVAGVAERVAGREERDTCIPPDVASKLDRTPPVRFSPRLSAAVDGFLVTEENRNPGSTRFLREAHRCAAGKGGGLSACLCAIDGNTVRSRYWFPEDHTSQYREQETALGDDLGWVQRSPDRLGHIDLWVHTTLAMRVPSRDGSRAQPDESTATPIDFPREQLDALKQVVRDALPRYLAQQTRSPSYDDFMAPLEDFVLLQRFTRAALSARLGRDFPVAKLIELERATRQFVPKQPTMRWEPAVAAQAFATALSSVEPRAAGMFEEYMTDRNKREISRAPVCARVSN